MSDKNDNEIDVEAVENVLPESLLTVKQSLGTVDGVEFAEDNKEVLLTIRYPADRSRTVETTLTKLQAQLPLVINDEVKTAKAGMKAVRVREQD